MKSLRVLVCGSNYGRAYVSAIRAKTGAYDLAGILARGSPRSRAVAERYSVPLYTSVADLPNDLNLACVAVGSSANEVVIQLLERGINVLCEHPRTPAHLLAAVEAADRNGVCFQVNSHFGDLEATRAFWRACSRTRAIDSLCFLSVMASDRALWGALDILRSAAATLEPFEVSQSQEIGPFSLIHGTLGRIPTTWQIQTSLAPNGEALMDGSVEYLVDLRLVAGFSGGILSLLSVAGPVVWSPNPASVTQASPMWSLLPDSGQATTAELGKQRVAANRRALDRLAHQMSTGAQPSRARPRHLMEVSRAWQQLGRSLRARQV
jgi:thiazolinyl imide reductase